MNQYLIMYVEDLGQAITITFTHNGVLDRMNDKYQAVFFPTSRTVYCSTKRWEEFKQCKEICDKKEFFQKRVTPFDADALLAPDTVKTLVQ